MIDGLSIDQVPVSWRYAPLGSFCEFSGGTQPPKSTFKDVPHDGYVRLLQIRDFETDNYAVYIPANKKLRIIEESDVSIARYGASVGRILTGKSGAINVAIMTTYPDTSQVWKGFLFYALQHPDFQTYLTGLGGRAAQAGFNKGEISRFKFPLPPLPEQRKIAGVLGVVQRAIEQQERLLALTAELKKVLLHQLFTAGLRGEPQKKTEIGPMPESWEINTVADVAHVKGGKRLPEGDKFADKPTPFPYIRVTDLREFGVDTSDLRYLRADTQVSIKRYTISKEDVYISIAGSIGITGMIPTELEGANLTENAAKMVLKTKSVSPRFLM
jgi:type I restriction enzyme S subunit